MVRLDSTSINFFEDLDSLDRLGSRSHDTVYVFYVRSGQKDSFEILSNMVNKRVLCYLLLLLCFVILQMQLIILFYSDFGLFSKSPFSRIFTIIRMVARYFLSC